MITDLFARINPATTTKEVVKEVWKLSGIVCPPGPLMYRIMHRSEMMYRSLEMVRLMKKQMWIERTLHKHAAVLETMNCTVVVGHKHECECDTDEMGCDCVREGEDDEEFFKSHINSGPN